MPFYPCIPKSCSESFNNLTGMTAHEDVLFCPKCKSRGLNKMFASFSALGATKANSKYSACKGGICFDCYY